MSEAGDTKTGPALSGSIDEVQALFPSDATLQEAIAQLTLAGYDRADFSLPEADPTPGQATPNESADNPNTDVDNRQIRNMTTGMAGVAGAFAAAAATAATGGAAAVAIGAAAAAGLGAGGLVAATNTGFDAAQHEEREERARAGKLVLAVHIKDSVEHGKVMDIARRAGATRVEAVERTDDEVSAAGWTG